MASSNFVFPPPPPPPPVIATQNYAPPSHNNSNFQYGRGRGQGQGRSRGGNFRGQRGGIHGGYGYGGQPSPNYGQGPYNDGGGQYPVNNAYPLPNYPAASQIQNQHAGQWQQPYTSTSPYPPNGQAFGQQASAYSAQNPGYNGQNYAANLSVPPRSSYQPNHGPRPVIMGPPMRLGFNSNQQPANQPFSNLPSCGVGSSYQSNRHQSPNGLVDTGGRGQKRAHGNAFPRSRSTIPKMPAAPAVPSFGLPLPQQVSVIDGDKRLKKKKRKHNQLGLTPRTEEHESSEEEDDVDEEVKLAAAHTGSDDQRQNVLQFSYKGRLSTLGSPNDIAAWIEERKKRFPTKAKAAEASERRAKIQEQTKLAKDLQKKENQKKQEERQKAKGQHLKKQEENRKRHEEDRKKMEENKKRKEERRKLQEEREKKAKELKAKKKEDKTLANNVDQATKERLRVEKLKRALEKAEKRFAKVEAEQKASGSEMRNLESCALLEDSGAQTVSAVPEDGKSESTETGAEPPLNNAEPLKSGDAHDETTSFDPIMDDNQQTRLLTPRSESLSPERKAASKTLGLTSTHVNNPPEKDRKEESLDDEDCSNGSDDSLSTSSSDLTSSDEEEDVTSSSGSSSSSYASTDDNDSAPEVETSIQPQPPRLPPPNNTKSKSICRNFLKFGRCNRGRACKFRHERPERAKEARKRKKAEEEDRPMGGMTLHQRLMARQLEEEAETAAESKSYLGDHGASDEQKPQPKPELEVVVEQSKVEAKPELRAYVESTVETSMESEDR